MPNASIGVFLGEICRNIFGGNFSQAVLLLTIQFSVLHMIRPVAVEDVKREVKILQELAGHENVVYFYNAFEDEESVYIVMELCEGGELLDRILAKKDSRYMEKDACHSTTNVESCSRVSSAWFSAPECYYKVGNFQEATYAFPQ